MKCPMNLVEEMFKKLNIDGQPVELIPYPGEDALKVLIDALVNCGFHLIPILEASILNTYCAGRITVKFVRK